jgi:hypothetical protein
MLEEFNSEPGFLEIENQIKRVESVLRVVNRVEALLVQKQESLLHGKQLVEAKTEDFERGKSIGQLEFALEELDCAIDAAAMRLLRVLLQGGNNA